MFYYVLTSNVCGYQRRFRGCPHLPAMAAPPGNVVLNPPEKSVTIKP